MSDKTEVTNYGGIGFGGLLTIVFIILKLTNTITWSWWWVLAPTWIPVALVLIFGLIYLFVVGCILFANKGKKK